MPLTTLDLPMRLRAMSVHFLVTLAVAAVAAALVFGLWFPPPFARMLGGLELFMLVVACDLVLGPLISLVIYNRKKPRKELVRDYAIVAAIQLAALAYGLHTVAITRPVFVVLAVDRLEVVSAGQLTDQDLQQATQPQWQSLPWRGPHFVWAQRPQTAQERNEIMFSALAGKDLQHYPRYYRPLEQGLPTLQQIAQPLDILRQRHPQAAPAIDAAITATQLAEENLRWLPVRHPRGFWTALVELESGKPVAWLDLDPY
ncbi:hypothetical protein AAV94_03345 [Lampropedia cohaerens]|uniref:Pilus assembly protein n=1 Tax=Lampropedia cohaerens TaxID=1610491 RepID=A0A0U1Q211_9BURK|nr:TfpX/TfpZ family type IV pilin accessory protein [Lampropedia cohaerens]KKW68797.1 hypothetical protein AAV94_03345 [Lampropedia cohaerens]